MSIINTPSKRHSWQFSLPPQPSPCKLADPVSAAVNGTAPIHSRISLEMCFLVWCEIIQVTCSFYVIGMYF